MIVWLASYPRSGNTLLRTILKRCLGRDSFTDEAIHVESAIRSDSNLVGHRELPEPWPAFYEKATRASEVVLVKTHLPPRDAQPYIYVVRDGRSAVRSYKKYYESYVPGHRPSLYQIIAGDDAYGDWTSHHDAWVTRAGVRGRVVRFEELADIVPGLLAELAAFIGHRGEVAPWRNPFDTLAQVEPGFFREGARSFAHDEDWPVLADQLFEALHGRLLAQLGYAPVGAPQPGPELRELFEWSLALVQRNRQLARACDERLALIDRLSDEAQKRLDIINRLSPQPGAPA